LSASEHVQILIHFNISMGLLKLRNKRHLKKKNDSLFGMTACLNHMMQMS